MKLKKRYSRYIKVVFIAMDLTLILGIILLLGDQEYLNRNYILYSMFFWVLSSLFTGFYKVYRATSYFRIIRLLVIQFFVFTLGFFSYFSIFREGVVVHNQAKVLSLTIFSITVFKLIGTYLLKNLLLNERADQMRDKKNNEVCR